MKKVGLFFAVLAAVVGVVSLAQALPYPAQTVVKISSTVGVDESDPCNRIAADGVPASVIAYRSSSATVSDRISFEWNFCWNEAVPFPAERYQFYFAIWAPHLNNLLLFVKWNSDLNAFVFENGRQVAYVPVFTPEVRPYLWEIYPAEGRQIPWYVPVDWLNELPAGVYYWIVALEPEGGSILTTPSYVYVKPFSIPITDGR